MFCPRPLHQLPELPGHVFSECAACLEQRSSQTIPLLMDAGSARTKGGQVMFCPRPLHQLRSQVFSEGAACLRMRALVAPLA